MQLLHLPECTCFGRALSCTAKLLDVESFSLVNEWYLVAILTRLMALMKLMAPPGMPGLQEAGQLWSMQLRICSGQDLTSRSRFVDLCLSRVADVDDAQRLIMSSAQGQSCLSILASMTKLKCMKMCSHMFNYLICPGLQAL